MSKKILFVVNHSEFFFSHRLPFALGARENGFDVHVATSPSGMEEQYEQHGLIWHELKKMEPGGKNPAADLKLMYELYELYKDVQPDVIHHVTIKPVLYGGMAARWAGIKGVVNALSGLGYLFRSEDLTSRVLQVPIRAMLKFSLNHPNSIFLLQNPDDVQLVKEMQVVDEDCITLIRGSGVDMQEFTPADTPENDLPIVLFASRMIWDKGVGEFVEAAEIINRNAKKARFVLAGKPDHNNPNSVTEEQLRAWDESGQVEWWGFCENMVEVLQGSSIVSLPSYYGEGVPKILIEAAACGKPIITTNMPGCREIVEDGYNGFLVQEKNSKDLAQKTLTLLAEKEKRMEMGKNGRTFAREHFSLQRTKKRTLKLYDTLLGN
ncbi:glycosyltransferase family 4 protein [Aliifodinibius salicampi]|uniref:Glycosyltransferase family 4 protein n=1 Tax=Fodinibius salicampi TaxID=1920655 RepID=A0ABT3PZ09_9BACT|nr:glycosyltransferase family 4 protein [Fodinibius salicampi]MCW9713075.1 glycosyltransferase family 4 protein [Fodinibius salicampi]